MNNTDVEEKNFYIVISADIINSRKYEADELAITLERKLELLNEVVKNEYGIDRKFYSSRGDEIQIIMPFNKSFPKILMLTFSFLRPLKLRVGLGIGEFEGEFKENSWDMNGSIFLYARNKLDELKKSKGYSGLVGTSYNKLDYICKNVLYLNFIFVNMITEKQWEAIKFSLTNKNVSEITGELGITSSSYYERLSKSNLAEILVGFETIYKILGMLGNTMEENE